MKSYLLEGMVKFNGSHGGITHSLSKCGLRAYHVSGIVLKEQDLKRRVQVCLGNQR